MYSKDGNIIWRLDWHDAKGAHINWKYKYGEGQREFYSGAITIDKMNYEQYCELINRFPRLQPLIGRN